MKRIISLVIIMSCLLLSACTHNDPTIGVIGGADGPTSLYIKGDFGEQYEKKPIRMFNAGGELYYDSGLVSEMTPRCGTLDGELKKTVKENEIPLKSGEANFEIEGYQTATTTTKEVNIDGEWVIFKKFDMSGRTIDGLKYCYYIKGHLNNAAVDSEIIVLSENADITFNDVYEPLFSSQSPADANKGGTIHNQLNTDKWGLTLFTDKVSPIGLNLKIEQFGGSPTGDLETGYAYSLEANINDEWQPVKTKDGHTPIWALIGLQIKKNDITEMNIDWSQIYGTLPSGFYKLKKEIVDFRAAGDYDEEVYEVHFTIE